jgi:two-component system, NtrC family, response regulator HydG
MDVEEPKPTRALSPQQVARLLDGIREPAVVIATDHTILAANQAYAARFAPTARNLLGAQCHAVSHGYDRPCPEMGESCPIANACASEGRYNVLHEHVTPLGLELEELSVLPIPGGAGFEPCFLELVRPLRILGGRIHQRRLIGRSPAFRRMMNLVDRVAGSDTPVLLLGESGTGKELVATTIHRRSPRCRQRFAPVDCSGLAETLFESELFGHEKGAFTGATFAKKGLVEAVAGGTLFLDEVGDVPLSEQVKLLRLIENGTFRRVGGLEQRSADFRLICATHRDLAQLVREGRFREDLYYRISAFPIELPPLRERREDLPLLVEGLLQQLNAKLPCRVTDAALDLLADYRFPGNVRELLNILQRACLLSDGLWIEPEHLPDELSRPGLPEKVTSAARALEGPDSDGVLSLDEVERRYLRWALSVFLGDRRALAAKLGMSERTLYRRLAVLGAASSAPPISSE